MSNIVFILGAGASKQAGAPLMANFLDVAEDIARTTDLGISKIHFERVFRAIGELQVVHSKAQLDLNNIESIFTALELGKIIKRVPGINTEDIPATIASLKALIVNTLQETMLFPIIKAQVEAPSPYGDFAKLIYWLAHEARPIQRSSVITFNYDMAADVALFRAGLGPNYAIDGERSGAGVDLLKLHGSISWAIERESRRILPIPLREYFRRYGHSPFNDTSKTVLRFGSNLYNFFHEKGMPPVAVEEEPVIVPPSWNKADYHHTLSDIWATAASHLSEAEHIFIVGYSLPETDSFFRHLFALGSVGKSALRRLVVFNPNEEVDVRFRSLLGPGALARYEFRPTTFGQSIRFIDSLFQKA